MSLRLVPLGTNGFFPTYGRQTMSFLVLGEGALLLDAGSGVGRLAQPEVAALLEPYDRLDVLLTHYHLDHVVGLSYLPGAWRQRPVRIFAPERPLVDALAGETLDRLLRPPLFPLTLDRFPMPVEVCPYAGESLRIGELALILCSQNHPGRSVGVRLGDALAYVTDTTVETGKAEFVRGVGLLLHEVWVTDEEAAADPGALRGHSAASGVAELARRAAVGRLMPVHHHPCRTPEGVEELARSLAAMSGVEVVVPEEGTVYTV